MEKEKMLRGELYFTEEETLIKERTKAKELCFAINQQGYTTTTRQRELLQQLFGHIGENTCVLAPIFCDYGITLA